MGEAFTQDSENQNHHRNEPTFVLDHLEGKPSIAVRIPGLGNSSGGVCSGRDPVPPPLPYGLAVRIPGFLPGGPGVRLARVRLLVWEVSCC